MKPVNKNVTDSYHRESESGVDAVFARMLKVVGDYGEGYAKAFDVSENTIKTWRRRGAVSLKYLEGFARDHGVSLDQLLYGERAPESSTEKPPVVVLSLDEQLLIERYRSSPPQLRDAALRVLLGGEAGAARVQRITTNHGQITQGGKIINKGQGNK